MVSRVSGGSSRRRRPRRRMSAGHENNPVHYDGLDDELGGEPSQGGETPNEAVNELMGGAPSTTGTPTPQERMVEVLAGTPEYEKEYRLNMLHRLLIRKVPLDEIAKQLGVSVRTIQRNRQELYAQMRMEASGMNINEYVGDTITFFKEIRAMTMRIGTGTKNPLSSRLAALSRSMQSHKDMTAVLQAAGVFEVLKFKASEDTGHTELGRLISMTEKAMLDDDEDDIFSDMEDDRSGIEEIVNLL